MPPKKYIALITSNEDGDFIFTIVDEHHRGEEEVTIQKWVLMKKLSDVFREEIKGK